MLNKKIENILNLQVEREAYSSQLYLSMASWCEKQGLEGTSSFLYEHADEERLHMLKFINYINERSGNSLIPAINKPPQEFGNITDMFKDILEHEIFISKSINEIVGVCFEEKDFTTHNWVQWFVTEQIEEEALFNGILDKLKLLDGKNLYLFDKDLKSSIPSKVV